MNIRQLEYLVAVLDEGTFGAAADACHVSQPALSQAISGLERELGTALFRRAGRRTVPTDAGDRVAAAARRVLRAVDGVQAAARGDELASGRLVIAAPPTSAAAALVPFVAAFRERHPGVTVRIEAPERMERIEQLVASGACDLGVTPRAVRPPLVSRPFAVEEFVGVFPPGTDVPDVVAARDVAGLPLVVPVGADALGVELTAMRSRRAPSPVVETHSREALVPLVLAGAGVAFLPTPLAEAAAVQGARVARVDPPVRRALTCVYDPAQLAAPAQAFLALLTSSMAGP